VIGEDTIKNERNGQGKKREEKETREKNRLQIS
jgi:hypothetical protein